MFEAFRGKTNAEMYEKAFHELLMLPDPTDGRRFLGNSQREDFLPLLTETIFHLSRQENLRIFDVGAGSGEVVDLVLHKIPQGILSLEEPNPLLLKRYRERVEAQPNLTIGALYPGPVQDFSHSAEGRSWLKHLPRQDVILAIHMIYHLTAFGDSEAIDPENDLQNMLASLYEKLRTGGTLLIVYADQLKSMGGRVGHHYYQTRAPKIASNLNLIWHARNRLLRDGEIGPRLQARHPEFICNIETFETPSKFYARSLNELAILNLSGELGTCDERPFDIEKLRITYEYIQNNGAELGIALETEGRRKGMIGGNQPQVICRITKLPRTFAK